MCFAVLSVPQSVVEVDEAGTVAAAATAVIMNRSFDPFAEEPLQLVFERPFLFVIEHMASGAPLFVGAVQDPSLAVQERGGVDQSGVYERQCR